MEIAGTAVGVLGLASLYGACIDALDALSSAARYGVERELLQTKIEVERVRLMIWGDAVGLTEIDLTPNKKEMTEEELLAVDENLHRPGLHQALAGLLACFVRTFEDVEDLQRRYGLEQLEDGVRGTIVPGSTVGSPLREVLSATFAKTYARFRASTVAAQTQTSPFTKALWAVSDEKRFRTLIGELKAINDSLTTLLPAVRDRTRVRMRSEIMQSNDLNQLQSLVAAVDDANDPISETASLRMEILSNKGNRNSIPRKPVSRIVQVGSPDPTTPAPLTLSTIPQTTGLESPKGPQTLNVVSNSRPETVSVRVPSPVPGMRQAFPQPPLLVPSEESLRVPSPLSSPTPLTSTAPPKPVIEMRTPYNDEGALVIHRVHTTTTDLSLYSWLSGLGETHDAAEVTANEFHPSFELRYMPTQITKVASKLLETDVELNKTYSGWSPGSTSLSGFATELTFWRKVTTEPKGDKLERNWVRASDTPSLRSDVLVELWKKRLGGFENGWNERKGRRDLQTLIGESDFTWLDPDEGVKLRHQMEDILAVMSSTPVPSLESAVSIGTLVNISEINPNASFGFVDYLLQMLLAREFILRAARSPRRWHGGVTSRIIYDIIASDLWHRHMEIREKDTFFVRDDVRISQLEGIALFTEEIQWPYADEVRTRVEELKTQDADQLSVDIRTWDWLHGLVLPGAFFSLATLGTIYNMSPTLQPHLPPSTVRVRKGNYGIVYPQSSFWSFRSAIGKVLAPMSRLGGLEGKGIRCIGGWVGPCPSPSLPESTFGLIIEVQGRSPAFIGPDGEDADTQKLATAQSADTYHRQASDWKEPEPPGPSKSVVRLQTLRLSKVVGLHPPSDNRGSRQPAGDSDTPTYQARLDFQLGNGGVMSTFTLYSNSVFLAAPCCRGTHRIDPKEESEYTFRVLEIGDLPTAEPESGPLGVAVTVINATSGATAETYSRAWCCEKGSNAVIWKSTGGCCFKCALMLAGRKGVKTGVLIMVEGGT